MKKYCIHPMEFDITSCGETAIMNLPSFLCDQEGDGQKEILQNYFTTVSQVFLKRLGWLSQLPRKLRDDERKELVAMFEDLLNTHTMLHEEEEK